MDRKALNLGVSSFFLFFFSLSFAFLVSLLSIDRWTLLSLRFFVYIHTVRLWKYPSCLICMCVGVGVEFW